MSRKLSIELMREIACKKGGECLSNVYITKNSKLEWKCNKGHIWFATPDSVKNSGRWCPVCGGSMALTLEEMQNIAIERKGKCLSKKYENSQAPLLWECSEGHQWENRPQKIKSGQWCPYCAEKAPISLETLKKLAEYKGGKLLSTEYINSRTHLIWECAEGHQWATTARIIKNSNGWCPYCSKRAKNTFDTLNDIAQERGGTLLSKEIRNNKFKLKWQCKFNHQWMMSPNAVSRGQWCPICTQGIGERIVRTFLEAYFEKPFEKAYPDFLKTEKNSFLELDGFNKELNIAFEHQGMQHYKRQNRFQPNEGDFENQLQRDKEKFQKCIDNNVNLIKVPEIPALTPLDEVKEQILNQLVSFGYIPDYQRANSVNLNIVYSTNQTTEFYNRLKTLVENKSGKLLSNNYLGTSHKLEFQCENNHRWKTKPNMIFSGRWCPECAGNIKYTIKDIQKIAESKGGICLSTEYKNAKYKLDWECTKGHRWSIALSNVVNANSWCPYCRENEKKQKFIEELYELANQHDGKCLNLKYINSRTKYDWECKEGHRWKAFIGNIRMGAWCPTCRGK
jgi:hypothetical protein